MKQSSVWGKVCKAGLALAAMKYIDPIIASVLNVVGSLFVVFNSARLVRQGEEFDPHETLVARQEQSAGANPKAA